MSIAELKDNLSAYLGRVRQGEEIVVRDRKIPIAKIVPLGDAGDLSAEEIALVADGKLRPATGALPRSFWTLRAPRVTRDALLAAIEAEREE